MMNSLLRRGSTRRGRRGYAMVLFIIVLLVITVMTSTLTTTSFRAAQSTREAADRLSARSLAINAIDEFYSRLTTRPAMLTTDGTSVTSTHEAVRNTSSSTIWAKMEGSRVASCSPTAADKASECYFVELTLERLGSTNTRIRTVVIEVTTRVGCDANGDFCSYAKFQQRLRKVQFFDYLFFNQFSTLDPDRYADAFSDPAVAANLKNNCGVRASLRLTACLEISYLGRTGGAIDEIDGPVYTADDYITICGNPVFKGTVAVHGPGVNHSGRRDVWMSAQEANSAVQCGPLSENGNGIAKGIVDAQRLEMPSLVKTFDDALRESIDTTKQDKVVISPISSSRPVSIEFSGTEILIDNGEIVGGSSVRSGCTGAVTKCVLQNEAAILVRNAGSAGNPSVPVEVKGTLTGKRMVLAAGDVTIADSITYTSGASLGGNTTDALALVSGGQMKINQTGSNLTIHAFIVALNGAPFVDGWADPVIRWTGNTAPTLTVFGGVSGKYQGVFGSFDGTTGFVIQGYKKNFVYDTRLATGKVTPPPLLIAPESASWLRVDIAEVPVDPAAAAPKKQGL